MACTTEFIAGYATIPVLLAMDLAFGTNLRPLKEACRALQMLILNLG